MQQFKTYTFRIYPTKEQQTQIHKTFGCTRFVYNKSLESIKESKIPTACLINNLKKLINSYPFLKECNLNILKCSIYNLQNNLDKYNKKLVNSLKFKSRGIKDSYQIRNNMVNIKLDLLKKVITLPDIYQVKIKGYRKLKRINGTIINTTVKRVGYKYYVALCIKENILLPPKQESHFIGIDIGVKNLVVTSNNETYGNPRYLDKYEKKLKGLQKSLSRKQMDSKNHFKTKIKIEEVYRKLKNARKKLVEEIVSKITHDNDVIIAEKLQVKKMLEKEDKKEKSLRKEIANATFGQILLKLETKCKWLNKTFLQIDAYYPSSQTCSRCGKIDKEMKNLSKRIYQCKHCNLEMDRDLNASLNILHEGTIKYFKEKYN